MKFNISAQDKNSKARCGTITTKHGQINTPIFMPVGTVGSVKAVHHRELKSDIAAEIILGNTYHLYLRPGMKILNEAGGLHKFIGWDKPILTDSGGYQVYSLASSRKITEDGVNFKSHIDGSKHYFTPEKAIDIQRTIRADIIMAFDECTPYPCTYNYAKKSMEMTHRWLLRCEKHFKTSKNANNEHQTLFPIVQGSIYKELRTQSAEFISSLDLPGNAIGGVCHPNGQLYEITSLVCNILPYDKPRYLMGVGTPENILNCIALGIDMFDCVMPTRNARNGSIFTTEGIINIKNKKWANDFTPIDEKIGGYVNTHYSKAYLHHLIRSKEILGAQIASIQNLSLYMWIVQQARDQITLGNFANWKDTTSKILMQHL
jgi:queuine tRNA-ribosyltransferase